MTARSLLLVLLLCAAAEARTADRVDFERFVDQPEALTGREVRLPVRYDDSGADADKAFARRIRKEHADGRVLVPSYRRFIRFDEEVFADRFGTPREGQRLLVQGTIRKKTLRGQEYWLLEADAAKPYYQLRPLPGRPDLMAYPAADPGELVLMPHKRIGEKVRLAMRFAAIRPLDPERRRPMGLDPARWRVVSFTGSRLEGFVPVEHERALDRIGDLRPGSPITVYGRGALGGAVRQQMRRGQIYHAGGIEDTAAVIIDLVKNGHEPDAAELRNETPDFSRTVEARDYGADPRARDGESFTVITVYRGSATIKSAQALAPPAEGRWVALKSEQTDLAGVTLLYRSGNERMIDQLRALQPGDTAALRGVARTDGRGRHFFVVHGIRRGR
jgi:hypothetical protein